MKTFNRLVRDKIPDIMLKDGQLPSTRTLNDEEYLEELNKKLKMEVDKYLETNNVEELVDVLEVIRAICDANEVPFKDIEDKRKKKVTKKGAFKDKVYLIKVMEEGD